jgi:hypothetical protein
VGSSDGYIKHVVTGGFYSVTCLAVPPPLPSPPPFDIGILVSLGGEPAEIIIGTEATTAFTYIDPEGNYHFRVFERIQTVMRDGRAFQTLSFSEPTPRLKRRLNQGALQPGFSF